MHVRTTSIIIEINFSNNLEQLVTCVLMLIPAWKFKNIIGWQYTYNCKQDINKNMKVE